MKNPIRIYNPFLDFEMETDNYISLQFPINFYGVGYFELHVNRYAHGAESFKKGNIIIINKRKDKAGMILSKEIALDQNGKSTENWKVTGYTLDGLITRRITEPPTDLAYDRKSGDAETVMKHYIDKHFVNPVDTNRKLPRMDIATNRNRGDYVEWESRFKNVADELELIGKQAGLGWIVYADTKNKRFFFDVVDTTDATKGNAAGLSPLVFSPEFGTVESQRFTDSDIDYTSSAYVGGQGEGVERKIIVVGNDKKGLDRIETFVDARDIGTDEEQTESEIEIELNKRGQNQLSENGRKIYFEAQILTPVTEQHNRIPNGKAIVKTPYEYEKDFGIGYLVTVLNKSWRVTMNAQITELFEIHEASGFRLEATFGDSQPTLIDKINKKFDEITGVDKQEASAKYAKIQAKEMKEYADQQLSAEELERIQQAQENLEEAQNYTKGWAEQGATVGAPPNTPVGNRESTEVDYDASEGKTAKDKIDLDVGMNPIESTTGSQDKANTAQSNAVSHADAVADQAESNATSYADQLKAQTDQDLLDKAGLEYVNGELLLKADSSTVQTINNTVKDLETTASNLQLAVSDNEDELQAQGGLITTVSTNLDTVEGNLNIAINDLSALDNTISEQGTDISANTQAITLKADQSELETISGNVSTLSGELNVLAGEVELKASQSALDTLEDNVTSISNDVSTLTVDVNGISADVSSLDTTVNGHTTDISQANSSINLLSDQILTKVETSTFNSLEDRVDSAESIITQHSSQINAKAESSTVSAVESRVSSAELDIDGLNGQINLKADNSTVNAIESRVSSAEIDINGLNGEIDLKVNKNGVIGSINLSSESATIDAANINLVGAVTVLSDITGNLGTINAGTINGVTINGSSFNQTGTNGSITLDNNGLTFDGANSSIEMNVVTTSGYHGDIASLVFKDNNNNRTLEIYQYYTDSVIRSDRGLVLEGGDLGVLIDGSNIQGTPYGVDVRGGMRVEGTTFLLNGATFGAGSSMNLDQYGNLIASSNVSTVANWHLDNNIGTQMIQVYTGRNSWGADSDPIMFRPGGYGNSEDTIEMLNLSGGMGIRGAGQAMVKFLTSSDEIQSKTTSDDYYAPVRASSFPTGSMAEFKRDIDVWEESALDLINQSTIYDYFLKDEYEKGIIRHRQGLVIGDGYNTPNGVVDADGVEQYLMNSWSWKAIQELSNISDTHADDINFLKMKVQILEQKVNQLEGAA